MADLERLFNLIFTPILSILTRFTPIKIKSTGQQVNE